MIRVLIADDHAVLRSGLRRLVDAQADMEAVGEAADGRGAIQQVLEVTPDVVLLDITMPGPRADEVIQQIVTQRPETRVLMLTMHDDPFLARAMLAAGASGYVVKMAGEAELVAAIRAVHAGRTFVDASLAGMLTAGPPANGSADRAGTSRRRLSRREQEVLELLSQGYTSREIAQRIRVGIKSVETYRRRLAQKLGLKRRTDIIRYALEVGILDATRVSPQGN